MSFIIKKSALIIMIVLVFVGYGIYVSLYPLKFKNFEFDNPSIGILNTKIRMVYTFVTGKSIEIGNESKKLYDDNVTPKVNEVSNDIKNGIDTTKSKIDNVRKTLSGAEETIDKAGKVIEKGKETIDGATEVFNDTKRMNDGIIGTVNKDVVQ